MTNQAAAKGVEDNKNVLLSRSQMFLAYVSASYGFGFQNMVAFLMPIRARELGAPLEVIGLIVGIAGLMPAILSVPSGALADRIGSRKTFVLSTFATGIFAILFALSPSYWGLLLLQPFFGFFRSMGWVAAQTYITGVGKPEDRAAITGRFAFSANLGPLVAPLLIAAVAEAVGYQQAFLFVAVFGFAYAVVGLGLPEVYMEKKTKRDSSAGFGAALSMLRIRDVQVSMILTFVRLWLFSGWGPFFQLYLHDNGFRPLLIGTVLSGTSLVTVVVTLWAGRLSQFATKQTVTAIALALGVLGVAISTYMPLTEVFIPLPVGGAEAGFTIAPFLYIPAVLMGIGSGLSLPLLMAIMAESAPPGQRGVAMGLRTQANQFASMTAPITTGQLVPRLGISLGFAVTSIFLWGMLALALWLHLTEYSRRRKLVTDTG